MRYVLGCVHAVRKMTGGVFDEPVEPPVEKPTTPPSTEDLRAININDEIMAVVGTKTWRSIAYGNGIYVVVGLDGYTAYLDQVVPLVDTPMYVLPLPIVTNLPLPYAIDNKL